MYSTSHMPDIEQWSQSSGSNVIPRRAHPGLAGLGPHRFTLQARVLKARYRARVVVGPEREFRRLPDQRGVRERQRCVHLRGNLGLKGWGFGFGVSTLTSS